MFHLFCGVAYWPRYTKTGDPSIPTNNRPVCLTSAFRQLVSMALTHIRTQYYSQSLPTQWGFQKGTGTECAITVASNKLCRELPMAAVLDLRKAYYSVPCYMLQNMLDEKLSTTLSKALLPLLWPMILRTINQKSGTSVRRLVGMPQGDAPSPYLFNIFMDEYIREINREVSKGLDTLFVDDVFLLARSLLDMQRLLFRSKAWAHKFNITWAIHKSCGLQLPGIVM